MIKKFTGLFDALGAVYKAGTYDLSLFPPLVEESYEILGANATSEVYASLGKPPNIKTYSVFVDDANIENMSRPYRESLFIEDYETWVNEWDRMIASIDVQKRKMVYSETQRVLYSASLSFFAVVDLYKRGSRQTNGTFLERLLGTLLSNVTGFPLSHHIPMIAGIDDAGDDDSKVPTDIVLDPGKGSYKLVFPVKVSTRERIGQIFTHQRILDTEFPGRYRSALLCVSETQLMKGKHSVQETCVPGQVTFNEKYIAHIDALYYLDPPFAYINDQITVAVRKISDLFAQDLSAISAAVAKASITECGGVVSTVNCNLPSGHEGDHFFVPLRGIRIPSDVLAGPDVAD